MPIAYSYVRCSTPEQADGTGQARQRALVRKWAERSGVAVSEKEFGDLASGFHGDHLRDGAGLATFIQLAEKGVIRPGDFLLVENTDRISRLPPFQAMNLIYRIVSLGVRIIFLDPKEQEVTSDLDEYEFMMLVMQVIRGHGESKRKQGLIKSAWNEWRKDGGKINGKKAPRPGALPFWLRWSDEDGDYRPNDKADIVRLIYQMAGDGWGSQRIAASLRKMQLAPIQKKGSDGYLTQVYIRTILGNPAVYGREESLDADDHFPAVITKEEFFIVQQVIADRGRLGKKPREKDAVHLLSGVLRHWQTGGTFIAHRMSEGKRRALYYIPYDSRNSKMTPSTSFPVQALELGVLATIQELDPRQVFGQVVDVLPALTGEAEAVKSRIKKLEEQLADVNEDEQRVETALRVVGRLEQRLVELNRKIADERAKAAAPASQNLTAAQHLAGLDLRDEQVRIKVRTALQSCVSEVRVVFRRQGVWRMAWGEMRFKDSDYTRLFVVVYHRPLAGVVPEHTACSTVVLYDLRDQRAQTTLADIRQHMEFEEQHMIAREEVGRAEVVKGKRREYLRKRWATLPAEKLERRREAARLRWQNMTSEQRAKAKSQAAARYLKRKAEGQTTEANCSGSRHPL